MNWPHYIADAHCQPPHNPLWDKLVEDEWMNIPHIGAQTSSIFIGMTQI